MFEQLAATLEAWQLDLRFMVMGLTTCALLWYIPRAWRAMSDPSSEAAESIGFAFVLLGQLGFQIGYLVEGVSDVISWRNAANLTFLVIGPAFLLLAWARRCRERRVRLRLKEERRAADGVTG